MKRLVLALFPSVLALACSAHLNSKGGPGAGGFGNSGGTGTAGSSGSGGASGSGVVTVDCPAPELGSAVLRLLNGREFANTINTVFPQATG